MDGTSADVEQLKYAVLAAADGFLVEFVSVRYSRAELEELAAQLPDAPRHPRGYPFG